MALAIASAADTWRAALPCPDRAPCLSASACFITSRASIPERVPALAVSVAVVTPSVRFRGGDSDAASDFAEDAGVLAADPESPAVAEGAAEGGGGVSPGDVALSAPVRTVVLFFDFSLSDALPFGPLLSDDWVVFEGFFAVI